MATKTTKPFTAANTVTPIGIDLTLDSVRTNEITDTALSMDLHTTRKARADAERIKYVADTAEYQRDIAKLVSETTAIRVDIAAIKKAVTEVKRDTDAVIAEHQKTVMQSNVRLAANRANNKEDQVVRATNKSRAQGVTLAGTDYTVQIKLPTFNATVG